MIGLESLTLESGGVETTFPIKTPSMNDSYIVKQIDGLDPPQIDLKLQKTLYSGSYYLGSRPQERQIVILIRLNPNYAAGESVASLRDRLYVYLTQSATRYTSIRLNGSINVSTVAFLSNFESVVYAKEPVVQLTFDCVSAYFVDTYPTVAQMTLNGGSYGFKANMGFTALTGFVLTTKVKNAANLDNVSLYSNGTKMELGDLYGSNISTGDYLTINTNPGSRDVYFLRNGVKINFLESFKGEWAMLNPQDTGANLTMSSYYNNTPITGSVFEPPTVSYRRLHWGI